VDSTYDIREDVEGEGTGKARCYGFLLEQGQSGTPNRVYVETIETGKMEFGVAERGLYDKEMYDQGARI
jgi:hypothetical protein